MVKNSRRQVGGGEVALSRQHRSRGETSQTGPAKTVSGEETELVFRSFLAPFGNTVSDDRC